MTKIESIVKAKETIAENPLGLLKNISLFELCKRGKLLMPHHRQCCILKLNRVNKLMAY